MPKDDRFNSLQEVGFISTAIASSGKPRAVRSFNSLQEVGFISTILTQNPPEKPRFVSIPCRK